MARDLLTESGSIFLQIGEDNVHLVRNILDEILGSAQFISQVTVKKTSTATNDFLPATADYVLLVFQEPRDCQISKPLL